MKPSSLNSESTGSTFSLRNGSIPDTSSASSLWDLRSPSIHEEHDSESTSPSKTHVLRVHDAWTHPVFGSSPSVSSKVTKPFETNEEEENDFSPLSDQEYTQPNGSQVPHSAEPGSRILHPTPYAPHPSSTFEHGYYPSHHHSSSGNTLWLMPNVLVTQHFDIYLQGPHFALVHLLQLQRPQIQKPRLQNPAHNGVASLHAHHGGKFSTGASDGLCCAPYRSACCVSCATVVAYWEIGGGEVGGGVLDCGEGEGGVHVEGLGCFL